VDHFNRSDGCGSDLIRIPDFYTITSPSPPEPTRSGIALTLQYLLAGSSPGPQYQGTKKPALRSGMK